VDPKVLLVGPGAGEHSGEVEPADGLWAIDDVTMIMDGPTPTLTSSPRPTTRTRSTGRPR